MLEVMISVIVLSLGMVGVLGANIKGFANTNSSGYRTQATWLAAQIVERARANLTGDYTIGIGASTGGVGQAATDLAAWKALLSRSLPMGDASITVSQVVDPTTTATVRRMQILVRWDDRRATTEDGVAGSPVYKYFMTETYLAGP